MRLLATHWELSLILCNQGSQLNGIQYEWLDSFNPSYLEGHANLSLNDNHTLPSIIHNLEVRRFGFSIHFQQLIKRLVFLYRVYYHKNQPDHQAQMIFNWLSDYTVFFYFYYFQSTFQITSSWFAFLWTNNQWPYWEKSYYLASADVNIKSGASLISKANLHLGAISMNGISTRLLRA